MHSTTTTTHELTHSELERCRENLRKQWNNRRIDEALLQRAWDDAHCVATVLYKKYGATKVAVFGSLAERFWFHEHSDIDMVVWGLCEDIFDDASFEIKNLSPKFVYELIDIKRTKGLFRERIQQQSVYIKQGETDVNKITYRSEIAIFNDTDCPYIIHRNKLIQRISDEILSIQNTATKISSALQNIEHASSVPREDIAKAMLKYFHEFYKHIEKVFLRIAREVDMCLPPGSEYPKDPNPLCADWTYELIVQMSNKRSTRPEVISMKTVQKLQQFLKFCDDADEIDQLSLIYATLEKHAMKVATLYDSISEELTTFITFLNET